MSSEVAAAEATGLSRFVQDTIGFLRATKLELQKVTWPTRDELSKATRMIVVLSILLGLAIGWMDLLLNLVLVDGVAALSR
ncbi:MAG: preprotein translocase subunit SecE [Gemmatimonadales bacterium]